mmetsp:Transcript_2959/g.6242  ORF Transcript_2959/g.6242 Transcript_2959/m.6242 type:complete len:224 (+) Transcript_2959:63-734(+)
MTPSSSSSFSLFPALPRSRTMRPAARRTTLKVPAVLTRRSLSKLSRSWTRHDSGVPFSLPPPGGCRGDEIVFLARPIPAQFTTVSTGEPKFSSAASRAASTWSSIVTSVGTKTAPRFFATEAPSDPWRSQRITLAPHPAKRSAVARPSPEAAPVIRAIRGARERGMAVRCKNEQHSRGGGGGSSVGCGWLLLVVVVLCWRCLRFVVLCCGVVWCVSFGSWAEW